MEVNYQKVFHIVVFANLPFMALYILAGLIPPIKILGFLITSLLLIVGLVENFQAPKRPVIKVVGGLFAIYLVFWVVQMINLAGEKDKVKSLATPESLKILEQELEE